MKKIKCVIMDWAGTAVDYGCFAPVAAFIEAFAEKGIKVDAGYEVKYETEDVLSLEITANENWASGYQRFSIFASCCRCPR